MLLKYVQQNYLQPQINTSLLLIFWCEFYWDCLHAQKLWSKSKVKITTDIRHWVIRIQRSTAGWRLFSQLISIEVYELPLNSPGLRCQAFFLCLICLWVSKLSNNLNSRISFQELNTLFAWLICFDKAVFHK